MGQGQSGSKATGSQMTIKDYRSLVHTPAESSTNFVAYAEKRAAGGGLTWGISGIDRHITPMHGGDVIALTARPGHGKSSVAAFLARRTGKLIMERGDEHKCAVYVTWEQGVEEIETFFQIGDGKFTASDVAWGRADLGDIRKAAIKRLTLPVFIIGKSVARRGTMPRMTVETVYHSLETMEEDYHIKPELVCMDYIQIVPVERAADRIQQVNEAVIRAKELAIDLDCPIVICTQAGRQVDKYDVKIPAEGDPQWSSGIEQTIDKEFGLWRPWKTEPHDGPGINVNGRVWPITQNLFIIKNTKQRGEDSGQIFVCHFAPEYVRLAEMEKDVESQ